MAYFRHFPKIIYDNRIVTDITIRAKMVDVIGNNPYVFLPYTIEDGETAEEVAHYYYGNATLSWIVYFSNDIIDPHHQWPMIYATFINYLIKKYKAEANADGFSDVIAWTKTEAVTSNIVTVRNLADPELHITYDTYTMSPDVEAADWQIIRVYDHEDEINENKRQIRLMNSSYTDQAISELKRIMNE